METAPHSGHAGIRHHAQLPGIQADLGVTSVATNELGVGPGRTRDLAALHGLELNIVDYGPDRQAAKGRGVAGLHVNLVSRDDLVANAKPLWGQDVGQFTVSVVDQGDEGGAVRVIFEPLDSSDHAPLAALEVDDAIEPFGPSAAKTNRDPSAAAAAARLGEPLDQALLRPPLMQLGTIDQHQATPGR